MYNDKFWTTFDKLLNESEIEIDRPKGTSHPKRDEMIYPVDYGYLKGTKSPDNAGIDVYVGSAGNLIIDAVICTVDLYKRDSEIKLLVGCTEQEKDEVFKIYSEYYETLQGILIRRVSCTAIIET